MKHAPRGIVQDRSRSRAAHADYLDWSTPKETQGSGVDMGFVIRWLRDNLAHDAILTNGAGNYSVWLHRFYRYRERGTQLAPTSGSMGYGVPAAVAGTP